MGTETDKDKSESQKAVVQCLIMALLFALFAGLGWLVVAVIPEVVIAIVAVVCSGMAIGLLAVTLSMWLRERRGKKPLSPYAVFAVTLGILCIASISWALYDIETDNGWFAGLGGMIMLLFVTTTLLGLIALDGVVVLVQWLKKRKRTADD